MVLQFCGLFLAQWCLSFDHHSFDCFNDVQFLSFRPCCAFAVILKTLHYGDEGFFLIFIFFCFWFCGWVCDSRFCLFVFRQNLSCMVETSLSWLNLPNAGITGVCHFTPSPVDWVNFYIWRGVSRDLIWCIWDCPLSQHYLLSLFFPPCGSGILGLCLWLCQYTPMEDL